MPQDIRFYDDGKGNVRQVAADKVDRFKSMFPDAKEANENQLTEIESKRATQNEQQRLESSDVNVSVPTVPKVDLTLSDNQNPFSRKGMKGAIDISNAHHRSDPDVQFRAKYGAYKDNPELHRDEDAPEMVERRKKQPWYSYIGGGNAVVNATKQNQYGEENQEGATKTRQSQEYLSTRASKGDRHREADMLSDFLTNTQSGRDAVEYDKNVTRYFEELKPIVEKQRIALQQQVNDVNEKRKIYGRKARAANLIIQDEEKRQQDTSYSPTWDRKLDVERAQQEYKENYEALVALPEPNDVTKAQEALTSLKNMKEALNDRDKSAVQQYLGEIKRNASKELVDAITFGTKGMIEDVAGVKGGHLTDKVMKTTQMFANINENLMKDQRSLAQDIALGSLQNAGFILQMGLTSGIAKGIVSAGGKVVSKLFSPTTKAIARRVAFEAGGKAVSVAGREISEVFVQAFLMPSTLASALERNAANPGHFLNSWAAAYKSALVEVGSERIGDFIPMGKFKSPLVNKVMQATHLNNIPVEFLEEQIGTLGHIALGTGEGEWSDFTDKRNQLVTLGVVTASGMPYLAIESGGYAAGKYQVVKQKYEIGKSYKNNVKEMQAEFGEEADDIMSVIESSMVSMKDDLTAIQTLTLAIANTEGLNKEQQNTVFTFAMAATAKKGLERAKQEAKESAKQANAEALKGYVNESTGTVTLVNVAGMDTPVAVQGDIVFTEDGKIDTHKSGVLYYTDNNGKKQVVNPQFVDLVESTPADQVEDVLNQTSEQEIENEYANDEVRAYEAGEVIRYAVNEQQSIVGTIQGVDNNGNYIVYVDGFGEATIEPRMIVPEDNLKGVQNGAMVEYTNDKGEIVVGEVQDMISLRNAGLVMIDGQEVRTQNIIGVEGTTEAENATIEEEATQQEAEETEVTPEQQAQQNNRQQLANELFESNPELANEVYETVGVKLSLKNNTPIEIYPNTKIKTTVFHGGKVDKFTTTGSTATANVKGKTLRKAGIYFTTERELAEGYAGYREDGEVYEVAVNIQNPYYIKNNKIELAQELTEEQIKELEAQGYDGIIWEDGLEVIAFREEQVTILNKKNDANAQITPQQKQQAEQEKETFIQSLPVNNKGEIDQKQMTTAQTMQYFEYQYGVDETIKAAEQQAKNKEKQLKTAETALNNDPFNIAKREKVSEIQAEVEEYKTYVFDKKKAKAQEIADTSTSSIAEEQAKEEQRRAEAEAQKAQQETQQEAAQAAQKEIRKAIEELSAKLNTPFTIYNSAKEIPESEHKARRSKAKAWYIPSTGEVFINAFNATSVQDVRVSIFHEVVAHKGMRDMLGKEKHAELMNSIFDALPKQIQDALLEKYKSKEVAADEYVAYLAENEKNLTPQETGTWESIKQAVVDFIENHIGIKLTEQNVDDVIRGLLVESKARLENLNKNDATINNDKQKAKAMLGKDSAFKLFENEGKWKVITSTYKGRAIANFVFNQLKGKELKEYNKLRDEIDNGLFDTKTEAFDSLNKIREFEYNHADAFIKAKKNIDDINKQQEPGVKQEAKIPNKIETNGYQIYETDIKTKDGVKKFYAVPAIENKNNGKSRFGDSLHQTLEEAIEQTKENAQQEAYISEETKRVQQDKAKAQQEAKEKAERNKGKTPAQIMQEARAEKVLSKKFNYSEYGVLTRKQFIDKIVKEGRIVERREVNDTAAINRLKNERDRLKRTAPTGNQSHPKTKRLNEINDILNSKDKLPKKTEHIVYDKNRLAFTEVTKTEYDYFNDLKGDNLPVNLVEVAKESAARLKEKKKVDDAVAEVDTNPTAQQYGSQNKIISQDQYNELREKLKNKLNNLNIGFDPEVFSLGAQMAAYHIEAGAVKFKDFAQRMIADVGEVVKPYLKAFYEGARLTPGFENLSKQMDAHKDVVNADVENIEKEEVKTKEKQTKQQPKTLSIWGEDNTKENKSTTKQSTENATTEAKQQERGSENTDRSLGEKEQQEPGGLLGERVDRSSAGNIRTDQNRSAGVSTNTTNEKSRDVKKDAQPKRNTRNNRGERGVDYAPTSPKARFNANISAINTMRKLIESGKEATQKEIETLRKYSGWGGLGTYFNNTGSENTILRSTLDSTEYDEATKSINSAYFTPTPVIDVLWDVVEKLGFKGGNILESSAGIGSILSVIPENINHNSNIEGVEIDPISGNILKLLYPDANIQVKGFEETNIKNGSVDLAITNVPFVTGLSVFDKVDKDLSRKFKDIHDYFIAKNIRKLRAGGIGVFITSSGTLDKSNSLKEWITAQGRADVIGAFRLNNETFGGTKATSDIIIVRKRAGSKPASNAINILSTEIVRSGEYKTGETYWDRKKGEYVEETKTAALEYNSYFVQNPQHMGGEMAIAFEKGETYRPSSTGLYPKRGVDQLSALNEWAKSIDKLEEVQATPTETTGDLERTEAREGTLVMNKDGELSSARQGELVPLGINKSKVRGHEKVDALNDYNAIKQAIDKVLEYQLQTEDNAGLKPIIKELNDAYDTFVDKYGNLNKNVAISFLRNDVDFPTIVALEDYSETVAMNGKRTGVYKKTAVFKDRVIGFKSDPAPTNVKDAVIASMYVNGGVDIAYMAEKLNMSEEQVKADVLKDNMGFVDPSTGNVEVRYEYLSGNVRQKLQLAKDSNTDGDYNQNIAELEKVIPMDIPAHLIEFSLGSSWMHPKVYTDFIHEKYGVRTSLHHSGGAWIMEDGSGVYNEKNKLGGVRSDIVGKAFTAHQLIGAALNNRTITFSKSVRNYDGTTETIYDKEASQTAVSRIGEIKDEFKEWARDKMLKDDALAQDVAEIYNEKFNAIVPKKIDEMFLPDKFDGAATDITLYPHQKQAVVRATTEPLMLAHEVGTGKSFTLISIAMEMRRLGTAKKPMIVVQNATVGQFVSETKRLYPNAKVLTLSDKDRTAQGRREFYGKIKFSDWDVIIVPQSTFNMIPDSEARQELFIREKIEDKMHSIESMRDADVDSNEIKRAEKELQDLNDELLGVGKYAKKVKKGDAKRTAKAKSNAAVQAKEQLDRRTDDVQNFDDLGVDAILIDEAHEYKRLGFSTTMTRGVKGVDPSRSKRAGSMYLKSRAVLEKSGGKNVVFATGTPISNTAAEIWTFMKYLIPKEKMIENEIYYFDDFVRNFGKIEQTLEFTTSGQFKENTRFGAYMNVPELIRIWGSASDTVLTKDVDYVNDKVPDMESGKAQDIFLPQSNSLVTIMKAVKAKLKEFEQMTGKQKKENGHIPLVMYGIAKRAAIDARLVDKNAADDPQSKTNRAIEETLKALKETDSYKGTIAIFSESQNRRENNVVTFNLFEDIKEKLIKEGVPENQIMIMESGMTMAKKERVFSDVNDGNIRVIIGNTATLGTGVNIQERLHTLIHMDAPQKPMDYTQRNGRILRQGNMHKPWGKDVRVLRFGVEDSLDVTAYQMLKTKSSFIDSVMDGETALSNNQINRILEESDEGLFDNPVAVLSGSQYALLKNKAERELRGLLSRKNQHESDQVYINNRLRSNEGKIKANSSLVAEKKESLKKIQQHFPEGKAKVMTIEGKKVESEADIEAAFRDLVNKPINKKIEAARKNAYHRDEVHTVRMDMDGVDFNVHVNIRRESVYNQREGASQIIMRRDVSYTSNKLGIDNTPVFGVYAKGAFTEIVDNVITGKDYADSIEALGNSIQRMEADNATMSERKGASFDKEAELEAARKQVKEYTELMRKELEEKEAKYAEREKEAGEAEINEDVDEEVEADDDISYRDGIDDDIRYRETDRPQFSDAIETVVDRFVDRITLKENEFQKEAPNLKELVLFNDVKDYGLYDKYEVVPVSNPVINIHNLNNSIYGLGVKLKPLNDLHSQALLNFDGDTGYLNQEKVKEFSNKFEGAIQPYETALLKTKHFATEVAQREIMDIIKDIDHAKDYYGRLAKDHNVLRSEDAPRFRDAESIPELADMVGSNMTEQARKEYDKRYSTFASRFREAWEDSYLPVKQFQDLLEKNGLKIEEHNDYYKQATHVPGKNDFQLEHYKKTYQHPITLAVNALQEKGFTYREIENYVFAKHGIERNEFMRKDEARNYADAIRQRAEIKAKQEQRSIDNKLLDETEYEKQTSRIERAKQKKLQESDVVEERKYQELQGKDYAGLTQLMEEINPEGVEQGRALEEMAEEYNKDFEGKAGEKLINSLWGKIKKATDFTLDNHYKTGGVSRDVYLELKGRYQNFVPLRGHDQEVAEDRWHYTQGNMGEFYSGAIIKAQGRRSRAESPFAYIGQMAHSSIMRGNKNTLNQTLLRLAHKDKSGLMDVKRTWYVNKGTLENPVWEAEAAEFSDNIDTYLQNQIDFEERMKQMQEIGMAAQSSKHLNIGGLFIKPKQAEQHEIQVDQNGVHYTIYINANPAIARSINGDNKKSIAKDMGFIGNVTRAMAMNFTTRNPLFIARNFSRDYIFANTMLMVKEDATYTARFNKNIPLAFAALTRQKRGTLDLNNETDAYVYEFMMNGGRTGFSHIFELKRAAKALEREAKKGGSKSALDYGRVALGAIDVVNDVVENATRFSTYMASRQAGRSITQSVHDAKNVTVNFNQKGAGSSIGKNKFEQFAFSAAGWVRPLYLFTNAAVQALSNVGKATKKHPVKMGVAVTSFALMGFLSPIIAGMIGGDDEEEDFMKMSDWDRQNNWCIPVGSGYIKIPLPHEMRVFHRLGDNIYQASTGRKDTLETVLDMVFALSDLVPMNPMGAADASWAELMPDFIKPYLQHHATNTSFMGTRIYNEWANPYAPGYTKVSTNKKGEAYAPAFLIELYKGLDHLTGGDGVKKGVISLNPDVTNHYMRGWFGGLWTIAEQSIDIGYKAAEWSKTGELNLKVRETPLSSFYSDKNDLNVSSGATGQRYYDIMKDVNEARRRSKGYVTKVRDGDMSIHELTKKMEELDMPKVNALYERVKEVKAMEARLKDVDGKEQKDLEKEIFEKKKMVVEMK